MSTRRKKDIIAHLAEQRPSFEAMGNTELDTCSCPPVSPLCLRAMAEHEIQGRNDEEHGQILPTPPTLNAILRTRLQTLFSSTASMSVMLLHVSQLEHIHITPETEVVRERRRYHPSASVVEQILMNVRRAIRIEDSVYLDSGKGAAIIFPNVDRQGAYTILERVYNSVNLLQAETIIPPLTHETNIVLGMGSYPEQGPTLEDVLASAGRVMYRLTLRPAITTHLWDAMPIGDQLILHDTPVHTMQDATNAQQNSTPFAQTSQNAPTVAGTAQATHDAVSVPFLRLPTTLPTRLKNLISYKIATEFRCVPVGRDHNRLTLAMADPTDTNAIHVLHEGTGMSIFPVACDNDALDALLAEQW